MWLVLLLLLLLLLFFFNLFIYFNWKLFTLQYCSGLCHTLTCIFPTVYCDPHSQHFGIVNKAEMDVFLELSCFFHDPAYVGNLISGSSHVADHELLSWL